MAYELLLSEKYDSALPAFRTARVSFENLSRWRHVAYCQNAIAICYMGIEDFDRAAHALNRARRVENQYGLRGSAEEAETEERMGVILTVRDKYAEAIAALEKSIDIRSRLLPVDSIALIGSHISLGNAWRKSADFDRAMHNAELAESLFPRGQTDRYPAQWAQVLLLKGTIESSRGEHDNALRYLLGSLSILKNAQMLNRSVTNQVYIWLAACHAKKGDYVRAIEFQKTALANYRSGLGGDIGIGSCYVTMGEQYANLGDYDKSIELLTEGLRLQKSVLGANHTNLAAPLSLLAEAYLESGQPKKALACVEQAIAIRRNALGAFHPSLRNSYEIKGDILRKRGQAGEALAYYRTAMKICRQMDGRLNRYDIVRLLILEGSTALELGRLGDADSLLRSALLHGMRSTTHSPVHMAAAYKGLGDLACRKGNFIEGLKEYQTSIIHLCHDFAQSSPDANPSPGQVRNPMEIVTVLAAKGSALRTLDTRAGSNGMYLSQALRTYEAAFEIAEVSQRGFGSVDAKLFSVQERSSLHEATVNVAVDLFRRTGDTSYRDRAFGLAERTRARVLLENIHESHVERFAGIPDSLLEKEGMLRTELNSCDILLDRALAGLDSVGSRRLASLRSRRFAVRREQDQLEETLQSEYPAFYAVRSCRTTLPLDSIQNKLDAGTALVEYFAGGPNLHIFVVKARDLQLVTVPRTGNLEREVRKFLGSLNAIDRSSYLQYGTAIYRKVIAPIRQALQGTTKLVLIPDGALCHLPFEALIESAPRVDGKPAGWASLPYLIRTFDVTYSYSASFYAGCPEYRRGAASTENFAGFAPVFVDADPDSMLLATNVPLQQAEGTSFRSITVDGKRFSELKYSEEEVQSISNDFRQKGVAVMEFLRGHATEEAFKREAGRSRFVHIATHGLMNGDHPRLSGLLFAPGPDGSEEDGLLYAAETYNMKLDADLLVLSSCESGAGKLIRGEGVMAITRGFFYAGARNIVVSLWRIYDKHTARFMQEFYRNILQDESYARALRKAKLRMIEDPSASFPGTWAGFVLIGS